MRSPLLIPVVLLMAFANRGWTQVPDNIARQKIDELQQRDSILRSEISGARVDRRVEITRLEGRIVQIEEQLREWQHAAGANQFAFVLERLAREVNPPTGVRPNAETSSVVTGDPTDPAETAAASDANAPASVIGDQPQFAQLLADDFRLSLEIQILDAQAAVLEQSQELASLQRLAAKGLASALQIERTDMRKRRSELQLKRLQQQLQGLQQLYPQFFADESKR